MEPDPEFGYAVLHIKGSQPHDFVQQLPMAASTT